MVTQSEHGSNNNTTAYKVGFSQPLNTTTHTCDELEHNDVDTQSEHGPEG
jgi:hypothetical protein